IINNSEIFTIKRNEQAIKLYIASDWFYDRGYDFFAYQYTSNLIQSSNALFHSRLSLTQHQLNKTLTEPLFESYMNNIVDIIASEAKVDIKY
ncbi:AraC family transcriptional regulator, partial [Staphylococcus aureus]|nr:AraC family transcriptional regulator [Staphylococcus aureus]